LNPDYRYDAQMEKDGADYLTLSRKVIRGGSWKDIAYFIQNGSRSYEYQDTCKSYVGFRCVQTYIGRSALDKQ
jgi:formylglycine-generating enzyme required for sulfatase activity